MTKLPDNSYAMLLAQKESLELVVSGAPLGEVLCRLTRTVEEQSGGDAIAAIMLLDEEQRLRNAAAPSLPDHYLAAIDGLPAKVGVGTCCHAAATGETVVTPSFERSPEWTGLAHLPLAIGLKGAWSLPILARDGSVLGTFGTYFRTEREPRPVERAVVEVLARTAAIAVERDRAAAEAARRTAELCEARDAAEMASRAKSQFLAVMSHELRTPLSGIIGHADLLASEVVGALTPRQLEHAQRIKTGAWHLVSLIDEVLAYSRLEAGKEHLDLGPVDVASLVRDTVQLLDALAAAKGIDLAVEVPDEAIVIDSDGGKVRQVVFNLVGNAIKFSERGAVQVGIGRTNGRVEVRVRDSGCGIPAGKHELVFEAFAQVDQGHTRSTGGTGLGLTVSRRLARLLGGDVQIESSAPGEGSCFVLVLPVHAAAAGEGESGVAALRSALHPASRDRAGAA